MTLEQPYSMSTNKEDAAIITKWFKVVEARMAQMHKVQQEHYNRANRLEREAKDTTLVEYNPMIHLKQLSMTKTQYSNIHQIVQGWVKPGDQENKMTQQDLLATIDEKHFNGGKIFTPNMLKKIVNDPSKALLVLCKDD